METRRLDELCVQITDCPHSTPQWLSSGKLVLRNFNIHNGRIDLSNVSYTDDETFFARNKRATPIPGDIVMSREAPMGEVAIIPNGFECCLGQRMVLLHPDATVCNGKFLMYSLLSPFVQKQIKRSDTTGSVVSNLCIPDLCALEIPYVNIERQECIVALLSDIDANIDNNSAISAELEGMAKDLYDYWFVQFDFPDENGKPYKSSGGKMVWNDELKREIPEGWENGIVSDLGTVVTGGTPSTGCAEYFAKSKSGHAWATPKDLSNLNGRYFYHGEADITDAGLKNSAGNIMPKGSVLFTTRAPIGYIAITANEACTNQGFKSIIPAKKFGTEFVFQTLKMLTPQMQRVGVGSTFKEVSKDVFSHQSIVIPSVNLLKKYAALTLDIAEKIRNTQEENVELTSLRDFLLPMLMNGQVKVKGA